MQALSFMDRAVRKSGSGTPFAGEGNRPRFSAVVAGKKPEKSPALRKSVRLCSNADTLDLRDAAFSADVRGSLRGSAEARREVRAEFALDFGEVAVGVHDGEAVAPLHPPESALEKILIDEETLEHVARKPEVMPLSQ